MRKPRTVPARNCAPGRIAVFGMPATVRFSPAYPGAIGCPSACSLSIESVVQMHSACQGLPWWARAVCTSPPTPFHPISAPSTGFFGRPFDACMRATVPVCSWSSLRMVG